MMPPTPKGGHFKAASEGSEMAHMHASSMAHSAHSRLQLAKSLGGPAGGGMVKPANPVAPVAPVMPASPGMMAAPSHPVPPSAGPGAAAVPGMHNYRAAISMAAGHHGVSAGPSEIHNAIDRLTQGGRFSPAQGQMLKAHHGPLVGDAGMNTMRDITHNIVSGNMGGGSVMTP